MLLVIKLVVHDYRALYARLEARVSILFLRFYCLVLSSITIRFRVLFSLKLIVLQ